MCRKMMIKPLELGLFYFQTATHLVEKDSEALAIDSQTLQVWDNLGRVAPFFSLQANVISLW